MGETGTGVAGRLLMAMAASRFMDSGVVGSELAKALLFLHSLSSTVTLVLTGVLVIKSLVWMIGESEMQKDF